MSAIPRFQLFCGVSRLFLFSGFKISATTSMFLYLGLFRWLQALIFGFTNSKFCLFMLWVISVLRGLVTMWVLFQPNNYFSLFYYFFSLSFI